MTDLNMNDVNDQKVSGAPQANPSSPPAQQVSVHQTFDLKDVESNKFVAALSYIGILFLVPMFAKKESPFAQFHARQGLVLTVIFFVGSIFFWIPLIGWLAFLFVAAVDVIALIKTLQGQAWEIPIVTDIVKKLNI